MLMSVAGTRMVYTNAKRPFYSRLLQAFRRVNGSRLRRSLLALSLMFLWSKARGRLWDWARILARQ